MIIIAICTNKGGVGKTTTSINLLDKLSMMGFKSLAVDLDPQANLTRAAGINSVDQSIRHLFTSKNAYPIFPTRSKGFDIIPADRTLTEVEKSICDKYNSHTILKEKLSILTTYDFIVLDCSNQIDLITKNALVAADFILCPIAPEGWSFDGFTNIENEIAEIKESGLNNDIEIAAVIIQKFHSRYVIHQAIHNEFKKLDYPLYTVKENVSVVEAQYEASSLFEYDPKGDATKEMSKIFEDIIKTKSHHVKAI